MRVRVAQTCLVVFGRATFVAPFLLLVGEEPHWAHGHTTATPHKLLLHQLNYSVRNSARGVCKVVCSAADAPPCRICPVGQQLLLLSGVALPRISRAIEEPQKAPCAGPDT